MDDYENNSRDGADMRNSERPSVDEQLSSDYYQNDNYRQESYQQGNYQQGNYQQGGYNPNNYPQRGSSDGIAVAVLVLGIVSIVCSCGPAGIVGLILSIVNKDKVSPEKKGFMTAGLITSIIGLVIGVLSIVLYIVLFISTGEITKGVYY